MSNLKKNIILSMVISIVVTSVWGNTGSYVVAGDTVAYADMPATYVVEEIPTTAFENMMKSIPEETLTSKTEISSVTVTKTTSFDDSTSENQSSSEDITSPDESSTEITTSQTVTTQKPTTQKPTTQKPTTEKPTTQKPTTTQSAWTKKNGKYYNDRNEVISGAVKKGMDISHHQGEIDWAAVKKSDIDFVIIRCGYGDNYKSQDDKYFMHNIEMCNKYKIPYGIYLYSYAMNMKQVKSEVKHTLRLLNDKRVKPTYPVFYDMEERSQFVLSNDTLYSFAKYYCTQMLKNGYRAGVYSGYYLWTTRLNDSRFNQWYKWIARYNSFCGYADKYMMWQSTSSGIVPGIRGRVDLNFLMYDTCETKGHSKKWITTTKATVFKTGMKKCVCKRCGKTVKYKKISKLKPTGHLSKKSITLKYNKKYTKLKVHNLAYGDSVAKFYSTNTKIAKVSKKGVITAKKKKGTCQIKVKLKSGKVMTLKVRVKRK